jgi:RNA polymerase sigma-70 factor, ECF subfamily
MMTKEEFEANLSLYHKESYQWALRISKKPELAQEVLQESYLKAYNSLSSFAGNSNFRTWLYTIIKNTAYDYYRKQARRNELDEDFLRDEKKSKTASQERYLRHKADQEAALYLLDKLSKRESEVIELVIYQGLKIKEAAQIMGVTQSSASSYLKRAKQTLKGYILTERENSQAPSFEQTYTFMIKKSA